MIRQYHIGGNFIEREQYGKTYIMQDEWYAEKCKRISQFPMINSIFVIYKVEDEEAKKRGFEYVIGLSDWGHEWDAVICQDMMTMFDFLNRYEPLINMVQ